MQVVEILPYGKQVAAYHQYLNCWAGRTLGVIASTSHPGLLQFQHQYVWPSTHLSLDKMAAILADDIFKWIFLNENDRILIRISLKYIPRNPIHNKPALVQVMGWCRTGDKPLPELMMTQFTDAYKRHYRGRLVKLPTIHSAVIQHKQTLVFVT